MTKAGSEIPTRTIRGVTVLSARGLLATAGGADALSDRLDQLLADGARRIVVDLQEMERFDSDGIGLFVSLPVAVSRWGGILAFAGVPRKVLDVMAITQLTPALASSSEAPQILLFETVEEAVAAILNATP